MLKWSDETRAKLAAYWTPENREKYRAMRLGKKASAEVRKNISLGHIGVQAGEKHPRWKGGKKKQGKYIMVLQKSHPFRTKSGYVKEQRLVAEKALGRYLKPTEMVHHVNGNTVDNRPSNLVICQDCAYHNFIHGRARRLGIDLSTL